MKSGLIVSNRSGFTLMEVLIAMTLLSVMVVLLFGTLRISAESWDKGEIKIAAVNDMAAVYHFFQRHLSAAKPLIDDFSMVGEQHFAFQGHTDSLQFVGNFPASAARGGLQRFTLQWQEPLPDDIEAGARINVSLTPFFPMPEGVDAQTEEVTLINQVRRFELSYFGLNENGELMWQPDWVDKESLPYLVKVVIERDNGLYWPDMIVSLQVANSDTSVLVDAASDEDQGEDSDDMNQDDTVDESEMVE